MTLHVSLPKELEKLVHTEVESGMYSSASEVVREALRNFFDETAGRELRDISEIRKETQETLRQYLAGEVELIDGETFFEELAERHGLEK